jgi:hypothetical protein
MLQFSSACSLTWHYCIDSIDNVPLDLGFEPICDPPMLKYAVREKVHYHPLQCCAVKRKAVEVYD